MSQRRAEQVDGVSLDALPIVIETSAAHTFKGGLAGPVAAVGRSMSDAVDRMNHTRDSLTIALSRQVAEARSATGRHRSWFGRSYNRLIGAAPFYVKLPAHHARQVEVFTGQELDDAPIPAAGNLLVRLDVMERALQALCAGSQGKARQ